MKKTIKNVEKTVETVKNVETVKTAPETETIKTETAIIKATAPEKKTETAPEKKTEKTATVMGLTLKGIPETAIKVYGEKLKNGKENSFYTYTAPDNRVYKLAVNFDSFDSLVKAIPAETIKTAEITATYKIRENGKTVRNQIVRYGENAETFTTYRSFYDRKGTGGIDTAEIVTETETVLYINRMSRFSEFETVDGIPTISEKVI